MRKKNNYLVDFFKKFDVWSVILLVFLANLFFYRIDLESSVLFDIVNKDMFNILTYAGVVVLIILNIGNFKNRISCIDLVSFVGIATYAYLGLVQNSLYFWISAAILLILVVVRFFCYHVDEEVQSSSRKFFAKFNYYFPTLLAVLLGIALSFTFYYINKNITDKNFLDYYNKTITLLSMVFPIFYLIFAGLGDKRRVNVLDYCYYIYISYVGVNLILGSFEFIPTLLFPLICFIIRINTFEDYGDLAKNKYSSALFGKFNITLPLVLALVVGLVLRYAPISSLPIEFNLYVLGAVGFCVILAIISLIFNKLNSKSIVLADYPLLMLLAIVLSLGVYFAGYYLKILPQVGGDVFKDIYILAALAVYGVCLLYLVIAYSIRLTHFGKGLVQEESDLVEQTAEETQAEQAVETTEETQTEQVLETAEETQTEQVLETTEEPQAKQVLETAEETQAEQAVEETPSEESLEDDLDNYEELLDENILEEYEDIEYEDTEEISELDSQSLTDEDKESPDLAQSPRVVGMITNPKANGGRSKYLSKLMFADDELKGNYSEVKNFILSYGASSRITSNKETFRKKGLLAVIKMRSKSFNVFLGIIPEPFIEEGYKVKNVSEVKRYAATPTMIKIKTKKSIKQFKEIFAVMMEDRQLKKRKRFTPKNYVEELIPNGEAILNNLGYPSQRLVPSINEKSIPNDMPDNLLENVPTVLGEHLIDRQVAVVYTDTLANYFNDGSVVNREILLEKGIIRHCNAIIVKGRGTLDKCLKVYAEEFDEAAIKMIYITNGTAILIKHD